MSTQKSAIKRLQNKQVDQNLYNNYPASMREQIDQLFEVLKEELSKRSKRKLI